MKDLYLTSTFSAEWNRSFNFLLADLVEKNGFSGYFAHRDTDQTSSPRNIFQQDIKGIEVSRIILAVAKNETPNWGAELGYAYAREKPIIAIKEVDHEIPLICRGMINDTLSVSNLNHLDHYWDQLEILLNKYLRS